MTYNEQLRAVMSKLDSDGADSEEEWAANILRAIGIVPKPEEQRDIETVEVETEQPDVVKLVPREKVNYPLLVHQAQVLTQSMRLASDQDQNQALIEANAEQRI